LKKLTRNQKRYFVKRSEREIKNRRKRKNKKYIPYHGKRLLRKNPIFKIVPAPTQLTLKYEDVIDTLKFIQKIKKFAEKGYFIHLSLEKVNLISEGAISMLLSVISDSEHKDIFFSGTKPDDITAKNILERSGFFRHMNGTVAKKNKISKNKILKTGTKDTHQRELTPEIHKAMETIWGTKARCPSLYGGIGEMMRNSCDHAFTENQSVMWHLGISHFEDIQTVQFSFVDNGRGIIKTYSQRTLFDKVARYFTNNAKMLETAFKDGIQSSTGLYWRGKGLPTIYEMYSDNVVKNLVVITNNIYLDFDKKIYKTIDINFSGTYYFWKIDKVCAPNHFPITKKQNNDDNN